MSRAGSFLKIAYLALGAGLLAWVLSNVEIKAVWSIAAQIGATGMAAVVFIYFVGFLIDSFTWQLAIEGVPPSVLWLVRAFKIRIVGEVFNNIVPAAGMAGEPVKAVLLKRYYGVGFREGTASLILSRTINMIAELWFLAVGFVIVWLSPLPASFKGLAAAGLGAFVVATLVFFYAQRLKITSLTSSWLGRWQIARRINDILHYIEDMDERLVRFYTRHRPRFGAAVGLAFVNWVAGAVEIWVIMPFLGHPMTFAEAWMIEAVVQLARSAAFLIPAGVGAQEGAFLLVYAVIAGSPELGVAVALVRRFREILWLGAGVAIGAGYSIQSRAADR